MYRRSSDSEVGLSPEELAEYSPKSTRSRKSKRITDMSREKMSDITEQLLDTQTGEPPDSKAFSEPIPIDSLRFSSISFTSLREIKLKRCEVLHLWRVDLGSGPLHWHRGTGSIGLPPNVLAGHERPHAGVDFIRRFRSGMKKKKTKEDILSSSLTYSLTYSLAYLLIINLLLNKL